MSGSRVRSLAGRLQQRCHSRSTQRKLDGCQGQWEAARAVGLSPLNVLRDIIFPQAIRKILPPLAGQFITLIKDSAIVSLISIQELTFLATEVASTTTKVFETWIIVGAMYFVLCYSFATLFGHLEKRSMRARR